MEPVAFPLRLGPVRRPLLRRPSEDSNVCICGPMRNDRARCVLGVDQSEQSLRRVYCTGGAGTTGSREGERRVDNDNSRRSPIHPEELAACRIISTLVPTSEFHALSALTATCATRKVPSSSTRWGDILPRQRVQPSGCLLRGDTTWPGSQADVSSNGSSFAASIFAYVVPDNGAAMTQSPPRLTLEWLMPQELGA